VDVLIQKYDAYMSNLAPSSFLTPIFITLSIEDRPLSFEVAVRSTDTVSDMRDVLIEQTNVLGNPIKEFGPLSCFLLRQAPRKESKEDRPNKIIGFFFPRRASQENENGKRESEVIQDETLTIGKLTNNNTKIVHLILRGGVRFKNEVPKCVLVKEDQYFSCTDCSEMCICKTCAMHCHKGHSYQVAVVQYGSCHCGEKGDVVVDCKVPLCRIRPVDQENVKYETELVQLSTMGFNDQQLNIAQLRKHGGNVELAVASILNDRANQAAPAVEPLHLQK